MARKISNNSVLFVGPSPATGAQLTANIKELYRLQDFNWNWEVTREPISQLGVLAPIERKISTAPSVPLSFSYFLADMQNEDALGFDINTDTSCMSSILTGTEDGKNFYQVVAADGVDAIGAPPADVAVVAFGNAYISSYSVTAQVGGYATVSVGFDASNFNTHADGVAQATPAVNTTTGQPIAATVFTLPTATGGHADKVGAIGQGDISVVFNDALNISLLQNVDTLCLQSFDISINLGRDPQQCLGSRFNVNTYLTTPIEFTFTIEAFAGAVQATNLANYICTAQVTPIEATVSMKAPTCDGTGDVVAEYVLKNLTLSSENFSLSVGPSQTVSITFTGYIGTATDTLNGILMNGVIAYV